MKHKSPVKPTEQKWQSRIIGLFEKPAKDFNFNPLNWKSHGSLQRDALNDILSEIGWITGVIENETSGMLIDGHARIEEALAQDPEMIIPYLKVCLTEDEEKKMLALFDPIGAMATTDAAKFTELSNMIVTDTSALMEVVADISARNEVNSVELEREENKLGKMLAYLKFNGNNVPLTEDEETALEERYQGYVNENGVAYGFASSLLGI